MLWDQFLVVVTSPAWVRPSPKVRGSVRCMRNNARGASPGKHSRAPRKPQAQWGDEISWSDIRYRQNQWLGAWRFPEESQPTMAEGQEQLHYGGKTRRSDLAGRASTDSAIGSQGGSRPQRLFASRDGSRARSLPSHVILRAVGYVRQGEERQFRVALKMPYEGHLFFDERWGRAGLRA